MTNQIIKQPNGLYCVFNSVVDQITHYDMSPSQVMDLFVESSREETVNHVIKVISSLESGGAPYHQFTMSHDEAVEISNRSKT